MPKRALTRRAVLAAAAAFAAPAQADPVLAWRMLAPGIEHAQTQIAATMGDRQLHAVRIDPARNRFTLLTGAATHAAPRTARQWARGHNLVAAINAAMFRPNGLPVGFAKADGRVIQPALSADRSIFTFNAAETRLLDLGCDSFDAAATENALQGIRMISCDGRNVWRQQTNLWSIACLAQDAAGKILFLHARSPLSVHDFINAVRALPLNIERAMYLEGGPEATLYARAANGEEIERFGSYETGFNENDDNAAPWPLPNVLGVVAR
jgi:uncharacterized protein YigE (DUF2233 family)